MGTDLVALLRCNIHSERVSQALDLLERLPTATAFERLGVSLSMSIFDDDPERRSVWHSTSSTNPVPRPELPNESIFLRTPERQSLYFGGDSILIYHGARWSQLFDPEMRRHVIDGLVAFCEAFGAKECIVGHDYGIVYDGFYEMSFDEILEAGAGVSTPTPQKELLSRREPNRAWNLENLNVDWPDDTPLPEGWERVYWVDETHYWWLPLPNNKE